MKNKAILLMFATALSSFAATWSGEISDSACGATHAKMMNQDKNLKTDRDCTLACIKAGGKYVFVSEGKVYNIANQTAAGLEQNAGNPVMITGTLKGDTITVAKVTAPKK